MDLELLAVFPRWASGCLVMVLPSFEVLTRILALEGSVVG
jgi:hypothetical protein